MFSILYKNPFIAQMVRQCLTESKYRTFLFLPLQKWNLTKLGLESGFILYRESRECTTTARRDESHVVRESPF
jgi:hypothetical protein